MSAPRRALIVIDVQNEYFDGALPIEYPDREASLDRILRAARRAHEAGVPVVLVQNTTPPGTPLFARGSHGAQLHPAVASLPHALLVEKHLPSAFAGTDLEAWLRQNGIDTLTVVGYMTHNCVDATVRHAVHAGFAVEVLEDATGTVSYRNRSGFASAETLQRAFMVVLQSRFANVMTADVWTAALSGGSLPDRSSIFESHRAAQASRVEA